MHTIIEGIRTRLLDLKRSVLKLTAVCIIIASLIVPLSRVNAQTRLVTIYADGLTRSMPTDVTTVGDVLQKAQVHVGTDDIVEPALDTQILDDSFSINVYRARPVMIEDGGKRFVRMTAYQSPRKIAESAGVAIVPEDEFKLSQISDIVSTGAVGELLTIKRAKAVTVNLYGTDAPFHTQKATVGELLKEKNIEYQPDDELSPSLDTPLVDGAKVFVARKGTKIATVEETVAFPVETITDNDLPLGQNRIDKPGKNGKKVVTYELQMTNDKETGRTKLGEVVTEQPVKQVVTKGNKVITSGDAVGIGEKLAAQKGWTGAEWTCLFQLWTRESGWRVNAGNPSSGAYGIPQSLPASKMASAGADYMTNPATQITWGLGYIAGRYKTPCGAWNYFLSHNSY